MAADVGPSSSLTMLLRSSLSLTLFPFSSSLLPSFPSSFHSFSLSLFLCTWSLFRFWLVLLLMIYDK
uniref:Uncharacterized protein n=1 Tax=Rhizophora mucronata TaxID=61149 RepID=A0A2P2NFY3_RHIMU